MHDSFAIGGEVPKVRLARVKLRDKPEGVEAETNRLSVPDRPFRAIREIVE